MEHQTPGHYIGTYAQHLAREKEGAVMNELKPELKPKYYMGAEALSVPRGRQDSRSGLNTYDTFAEAREAVSASVSETGKPRFIVKTVAYIEPSPPPVKVTLIADAVPPVPPTFDRV